jgi:hypothetical protein
LLKAKAALTKSYLKRKATLIIAKATLTIAKAILTIAKATLTIAKTTLTIAKKATLTNVTKIVEILTLATYISISIFS